MGLASPALANHLTHYKGLDVSSSHGSPSRS